MTREEKILEILKSKIMKRWFISDAELNVFASNIASLPLDMPTAGDIEKQFPYAQSYGNYCRQEGAKWAISEIERRNK
jgi:hypothetical protein